MPDNHPDWADDPRNPANWGKPAPRTKPVPKPSYFT